MRQPPKLVILDRDGVVNEDSDAYIKSVDEWRPLPGSLQAIARLNHADVLVAIVTNQSGVGRGLFSVDTLNAMHQKLRVELARVGGHVDGIFFCPHTPDSGCNCRKPAVGLLEAVGARFATKLVDVPFIGDSKRDVDAALGVGAQPVLVRTGKGMRTLLQYPELAAHAVFDDLSAAVDALLETPNDSA